MDEQTEEIINQDEEVIHNDEEEVKDNFEIVRNTEEVIGTPTYIDDSECNYAVISDLRAWLKKLELLMGYLEAELEKVRRYDEIKLVKYEILEVKREIEYTKWKLNKELAKCGETEVLGVSSKGPREPWLIVSLMRKYGLL